MPNLSVSDLKQYEELLNQFDELKSSYNSLTEEEKSLSQSTGATIEREQIAAVQAQRTLSKNNAFDEAIKLSQAEEQVLAGDLKSSISTGLQGFFSGNDYIQYLNAMIERISSRFAISHIVSDPALQSQVNFETFQDGEPGEFVIETPDRSIDLSVTTLSRVLIEPLTDQLLS